MRNKQKISDLRATITDEELNTFKDFESVLADREAYFDAKTRRISQLRRLLIGVGVITTLVLSLVVLNQDNTADKPESSEAVLTTPDSISLKKESVLTKKVIQKPEEEVSKSKPKLPVQIKEEPKTRVEDPHIDQEPVAHDSVGQPEVIDYKYEEAQPVDGLPALYKYFEEHLKYPETAVADSVEGSVFVQFTISEEGKPIKITIEQSLGDLFDKEAIRLIENMPLWQPATVNSQPIESKIRIPIHFSIKRD